MLTMTIGNLVALQQQNVKWHAGLFFYCTCRVHDGSHFIAVGTTAAIGSVLFYALAYAVVSTGAFGILAIRNRGRILETYEDLHGYARTNPMLALGMSLMMLSLIGFALDGGWLLQTTDLRCCLTGSRLDSTDSRCGSQQCTFSLLLPESHRLHVSEGRAKKLCGCRNSTTTGFFWSRFDRLRYAVLGIFLMTFSYSSTSP